MTLAKTMVIKSEVAAETINAELEVFGNASSSDPRTWKYYRNLAGLYHPTDTMMTVISMDTLEEIEFTRENLQVYRATANAYVYGSRYYRDLVARYPEQESLILGILNPVDLDAAIAARDGDILHYDKLLVESQEMSLIPKLQRWVHAFMSRWTVPGYGVTDDYYTAAQMGILFVNLPVEILNLRLEACLTEEAHSFHIREYLASHGGLDVYLPQMTLKQALFLYRNINYLQRNAGMQQTFNTLLERIINERNLPLARYDMLHDDFEQLETLYPEIEMRRESLNDHPGDGSSNRRTVDEVMTKQYGVARSNYDRHYEVLDDVVRTMQHSQINRLPTKVFESALLDTTDSVPYTKEDILLNHWLYMASTNRFLAVVNVSDPTTGVALPLTAKEAFVIFLYAFNKARGFDLPTIPMLMANRVRKPILPTVQDLRVLVNSDRLNDVYLAKLLEFQPAMGVYVSISAFREFCSDLQYAQNYQRGMYAIPEDHPSRGMAEGAASFCYYDVPCDLDAGTPYDVWFQERGFDFSQLGSLDLDLLANNILTGVTGEEIGNASALAQLQESMLDLMGRLSSYSVQYLQSINSTSYRILDTVMPRVSDLDSTSRTGFPVDIHRVQPITTAMKTHRSNFDRRAGVRPIRLSASKGLGKATIDLGTTIEMTQNVVAHFNVNIKGAGVIRQDASNV
jgi:hypothetical protein